MHARVATFEGGNPDQVREAISRIEQESQSGPPEGIPAVGLLMLHRADGGKVLAISLFETDADLEQGDATLNSMDDGRLSGFAFAIGIALSLAARRRTATTSRVQTQAS